MITRSSPHFFAALAPCCTACSGGVTPPDPSAPLAPATSAPDVKAILARMSDRYRTAKAYGDEGTFRGVLHPGTDKELVTTARFHTRWVAPDRLRFELHVDADKFLPAKALAVWTPRAGVAKSWFLEKVRDENSLDGALGTMQGVSHGLTGLVPRWLVSSGCQLSSTYELRGTVACGSSKCFQLEGEPRQNEHTTLFISTSTSALLKYVDRATITPEPLTSEQLAQLPAEVRDQLSNASVEPFVVESTIEFYPTFDRPINESAFAFDPTKAPSSEDSALQRADALGGPRRDRDAMADEQQRNARDR